MKRTLISVLILIGALNAGCDSSTDNPQKPQNTNLDSARTEQFQISKTDGGTIKMPLTQESELKIIFPQNSLASESTLSVTPLIDTDNEWLIAGFDLTDSVSKQGPVLNGPVIIAFETEKDLGTDISIVQRGDNEDTIIPTKVNKNDNNTIITAQVDHFSSYGLRNLTESEIESSNNNSANETSNYNWVIYVNDSFDVPNGPMKSRITVNFKAVNTSGDILGKYTGTATASTSNNMDGGGGSIDATGSLQADPFDFEVIPFFEPAPLTDPEEDDLAALEPAQEPDFIGYGKIRMAGGVSGTVTAKGYTFGAGATTDASTDSFTVVVVGPLVRLTVNMPQGTLYFDGYIIGEGK